MRVSEQRQRQLEEMTPIVEENERLQAAKNDLQAPGSPTPRKAPQRRPAGKCRGVEGEGAVGSGEPVIDRTGELRRRSSERYVMRSSSSFFYICMFFHVTVPCTLESELRFAQEAVSP